MALIPTNLAITAEAEVSCDNKSIEISDTTGVYSSSNEGGYGSPNPLVSDATACTVSVMMPDPTTFLASGDPYVINAYPSLPNITDTIYSIPNTSLGLLADDVLPDGQYIITYHVEGIVGNDTFSNEYTFYFYNANQIECCLDKAGNKYDDDCCCGNDSSFINYLWQRNKLTQICNAESCGDNDSVIEMIKSLSDYCKNNDCGC